MSLRLPSVAAALSLVAFTNAPVLAQQAATPFNRTSDTTLKLDPTIRAGVLPNGLRYFVRANKHPEKRAELRLAVNTGSIMEDADQLGMAHLIEHMAFNGTTHFKKNELISFLQSIGVRFGADLNAFTSFDETVYMLKVPTDTARLLDQGLTVLEDWAHGQLFDSTEVANERGVVVEEWRLGQGAGDRMRKQYWPVIFAGSRYADRLPIGTQESILSANQALVRRFYNDWYRPDLMAVIAVGDFDADDIVAKIRQKFSNIPAATRPRARSSFEVPGNKTPLVSVTTDKEATNTSVGLYFKLPKEEVRTVGELRKTLMSRLFTNMLNNRFGEISQKSDAPFAGAGAGKGSFVRSIDMFTLSALAKNGRIDDAAEALVVEAHRVDQYGFLSTEFERAKQNMLRAYERGAAESSKRESDSYADEYVRHFLTDEFVVGSEMEYRLTRELLPTISLRDVNVLASQWITDENRLVLAQAPLKTDMKVPTPAELLAVVDRAKNKPVTPWTETVSTEPLMAMKPVPGRVTVSSRREDVGITEWKLSNGARVLIKPTDFRTDEIRFGAFSPGGSSLVSDADYVSASLAAQVVSSGGLAGFSRVELGKKLTGKVAGVFPSISSASEGLSGSASPRDLETLLQLINLQFTAPRLDTAATSAFRNQLRASIGNRAASPEAAGQDTFTVTMASHHFRARPFTPALIDELNPQRAFDIYRDRFADASDFTFVFVGNVDTVALKPLAELYLASLPNRGRKESWKDTGIRQPTGVIEKTVRRGTEAKAMTYVAFSGPMEYTEQNRFTLQALGALMRIKVTETLREKMGGTYSPQLGASSMRIPRPQYSITAAFSSSPDNADALNRALFAVIDTIKSTGPSQADVDKVKETLIRTHETELKENGYWMGLIMSREQNGEPIASVLAPYDAMVKALSPAQIQEAARRYFDTKNYVKVVLLPEAPTP
ncbi:MAG: insulinase family protein [Gemmatimonadaceae bacterium]|nr:insulinase family protein [Geodermatophilaceae bacterium]MBA3671680.1 insulinase family protein [Gemmatimonadaceae bacterium]